jgi:putative drug exporter of the RND superfamily
LQFAEGVIRRKKLVILVWVLALLSMVPAALNYSHFVSYSTATSSTDSSESGKAQAILSSLSPENSSLIVVVQPDQSFAGLANRTLQFQSALVHAKIPFLSSSTSAFSDYATFLDSVMGQGRGIPYVEANGLAGAPASVTKGSVSPDNSTYLITLDFNVTESYRTQSNVYPAQQATPEVRSLAQTYFGSSALVTGQGSVAYDTQNLTAGSGFVFAFTFVFLAIAVAITLASVIPPLFALLFVSLSTLLGYVSIYVTGLLLGHVDFTVTYTLTAVLLGVSVDYLVFFLSRYREELRKGTGDDAALAGATGKAGFAILVSGVTVAGGLGALSLVSDLQTWGPVLLMAILLTVAMETTLLPALTSFIGPRMFLKRARKPLKDSEHFGPRSRFYRAASFSSRRRYIVVGVIVLVALPAIFLWFNLPTTYNFAEGLPKNLPSSVALNTVNQKFGSDLIYPNFVIVNFTQSILAPNGTLTSSGSSAIAQYSSIIKAVPGVETVVGPNLVAGSSGNTNPFVFNSGRNAYFLVFTGFDPYSQQALSLVGQLRQNSNFIVGGLTSSVIDLQASTGVAYARLEVLIVVVIAAILAVSFRSLKYPLISLTGVFISITWTTGILYLISTYILGEALIYLIPLVLFVILMSLGNDFTVFIFTRVKEEQSKFGFEEGLARGMVGSGAVVTALGMILAVSLGSLGLVPFGFLQQIGIAFVVSLLLDTFVIRTFYFPAMIRLLDGHRSESF